MLEVSVLPLLLARLANFVFKRRMDKGLDDFDEPIHGWSSHIELPISFPTHCTLGDSDIEAEVYIQRHSKARAILFRETVGGQARIPMVFRARIKRSVILIPDRQSDRRDEYLVDVFRNNFYSFRVKYVPKIANFCRWFGIEVVLVISLFGPDLMHLYRFQK